MPRNIIIVCNDTEKQYATYLQQLVSANDDKEGEQVGTKDGNVTAAIYSEKQYQDNLTKLSSTNYILFMGNGKLAQDARANMEEAYCEFGMHYGWLGRQAYMYAEPGEFKKEDADSFYETCAKYEKSFDRVIDGAADGSKTAIQKAYDDAEGIAKFAAGFAKLALGRVSIVAELAKDLSFDIFSKKDLRDQQYTMLTLLLYLNGLSEFLGE